MRGHEIVGMGPHPREAVATVVWPGSEVVRPRIHRPLAVKLAESEYGRVIDVVDGLRPGDWGLPTACTSWDVHALVAHVCGMARFVTTPMEFGRQVHRARARLVAGQPLVDAQTALQVDERADRDPGQLRAELRQVGPRAALARRRVPGALRRLRMPVRQQVNGVAEAWAVGYLVDVILTRDTWMHRLDLARATGRAPELTADHDGVLVADIVAEWARRHGQPCRLRLTGPAGGRWRLGVDGGEPGDELVMDAAEFCRVVSGRVEGSPFASGLLTTQVPF